MPCDIEWDETCSTSMLAAKTLTKKLTDLVHQN